MAQILLGIEKTTRFQQLLTDRTVSRSVKIAWRHGLSCW